MRFPNAYQGVRLLAHSDYMTLFFLAISIVCHNGFSAWDSEKTLIETIILWVIVILGLAVTLVRAVALGRIAQDETVGTASNLFSIARSQSVFAFLFFVVNLSLMPLLLAIFSEEEKKIIFSKELFHFGIIFVPVVLKAAELAAFLGVMLEVVYGLEGFADTLKNEELAQLSQPLRIKLILLFCAFLLAVIVRTLLAETLRANLLLDILLMLVLIIGPLTVWLPFSRYLAKAQLMLLHAENHDENHLWDGVAKELKPGFKPLKLPASSVEGSFNPVSEPKE